MQPRRSTRVVPDIRPLTPAFSPRPETQQLTHAQLVTEITSLRRMLAAERRRNATIEAILVKQIDITQTTLENVREAFFQAAAPKPTQGGRQ